MNLNMSIDLTRLFILCFLLCSYLMMLAAEKNEKRFAFMECFNMTNPHLTEVYSTRFKDYEILEDIEAEEGYWGKVVPAIEKATGRKVAMKLFVDRSFEYDQDGILHNDAPVLFHLKPHRNIVKLFAATDYQIRPYVSPDLVFEWANGGSVSSLYETKLQSWPGLPLSYNQRSLIKSIMRQTFEGVNYLHENHIIHRDLKPENLLIHDKIIKICDFGYSVNMDKLGPERHSMTFYLNSFSYRSPELLKRKKYSYPIDIWALGITFLRLIVRDLRMDRSDQARSILRTLEREVFVVKSVHDIPRSNLLLRAYNKIEDTDAMDLIIKCLRENPSERITASEALHHRYFRRD